MQVLLIRISRVRQQAHNIGGRKRECHFDQKLLNLFLKVSFFLYFYIIVGASRAIVKLLSDTF